MTKKGFTVTGSSTHTVAPGLLFFLVWLVKSHRGASLLVASQKSSAGTQARPTRVKAGVGLAVEPTKSPFHQTMASSVHAANYGVTFFSGEPGNWNTSARLVSFTRILFSVILWVSGTEHIGIELISVLWTFSWFGESPGPSSIKTGVRVASENTGATRRGPGLLFCESASPLPMPCKRGNPSWAGSKMLSSPISHPLCSGPIPWMR